MLECGMDVMTEALKRLCAQNGGYKAVAHVLRVNDQSLYQIAAGVRLPSGKPRGIGRQLREKLDEAYPHWLDAGDPPEPVNATVAISGVAATGQAGPVTASVTPEQTVERLAQLLDGLDADALQRAREALALLGGAPDSERVKTALAQALAGSLRVESRTWLR